MKKIILALIIIAGVIGGVYVCMSMEKVGQGEVGVVYRIKGGVQDETLNLDGILLVQQRK